MKNITLLMVFGLTSVWANFNFGECSGSGTFEQEIEYFNDSYENAITVGSIPMGIEGLRIELLSDKDVDIRLYGENDDKIVHWPHGIHNQSSLKTKSYKDVNVTYSGYNGINGQQGNEFIEILSDTPTVMIMKAFGYNSGYATVNYSWTGKVGCTLETSGTGTFQQTILDKSTNLVGTIPPNIESLQINLTSDKDIDIQLYGVDGTAIVAWHPTGLISGPGVQTVSYHGMTIEWSGYHGVEGKQGHEYIKITGTTTEQLIMKVYGYESGVADVTYSWGNAVENALTSGTVLKVTEKELLEATRAELKSLLLGDSLLKKLYKNEAVSYNPSNRSQVFNIKGDIHKIFPILQGNKGKTLAVAGTKENSRFAAFGAAPMEHFQDGNNLSYEPQFKRLLAWLITADTENTLTESKTIGLSFTFSDKAKIKAWIASNYPHWRVQECDKNNPNFSTCYNNVDLVITGWETDESNTQKVRTKLEELVTTGTPILYLHTSSQAYSSVAHTIADLLGFELPHRGNYWTRDEVNWSNVEAMQSAIGDSFGYREIDIMLAHFQVNDYGFNWDKCTDKKGNFSSKYDNCKDVPGLTKFEQRAMIVRNMMIDLDQSKNKIFSKSGYRLHKLLALVGDKFRQEVVYPMDKVTTDDNAFMKSLYADHAIYNFRTINPVQKDMGNFSRSDFSHITPTNKIVNLTSKKKFRSTGVYALPGQTVKITRKDSSALTVTVFINTLRYGATHEYQQRKSLSSGYNRPKYLKTPHFKLKKGETIELTSPYGGPLQLGFSKNDLAVKVKFENVGEHAYWASRADNISFAKKLEANEYDWAEIATAGFEVHSKIEKIKESISDPKWGSAEALAAGVYKYTSNYPHVLAGFKGKGVDVVPEIHDWAIGKGLTIETIDIMKHMNSDQALCGYGCSGNPYDAYWAFDPIGHGDIHEMGHSMQKMRFEGFENHAATNTFSYYTKARYFTNTGREPGCQGLPFKSIFDTVQTSVHENNITDFLNTHLWDNPGTKKPYVLKISAMMHAQSLGKIKNGWHVLARVHILEREMRRAKKDWEAKKSSVGFSTYSLSEINSIRNNDWLIVAYSYASELDLRNYFDMMGIPHSDKAYAQIASFGFDVVPNSLFVSTKGGYCNTDEYGTIFDRPTLDMDGMIKYPY